ncbi:extracellular solute-binding protein [Candidatus Aerophobetes bacterium]|nr:extracellular solute-binding protein [Candidatus Aerophobetes bacterium]
MSKAMKVKIWVSISLVVLLIASFSLVAVAAEKFSLKDIPPIKNKRPINTVVETGAVWDKIMPYIEKFTEVTGVKVNVERVASPVVYSKENVELMAGTGYYDVVYVETSWTTEWAEYLYKLEDLAAKYDPKGVRGFWDDVQNHSPTILNCGKAYGEQMVLPFYTYHMGMFIRQDVYDNPIEKKNFAKKYGYELKPPTSWAEFYDQAEFFTRKKGELLKGKSLTHDLYGVAMMAGAYQINDEISCHLWGKGSDYVTVVRNPDGSLKEFVITKDNKRLLREALLEYKRLLKFASPGCLTANFDFVVAQQGEGHAIVQPHQFSNCFVWTADLLRQNVPDGKLGIYPTIGEQPYTGAWSMGVAKDSKNPEASYWLVRYLASFECQKAVMKEGGQLSTRMDVLRDPEWHTPQNRYPYGILCDYLLYIWPRQAKHVPNYWYFNTKAGGKVYEMQMDVFHKPMGREATIDEAVEEAVTKTLELTSKFDDIPIREEK